MCDKKFLFNFFFPFFAFLQLDLHLTIFNSILFYYAVNYVRSVITHASPSISCEYPVPCADRMSSGRSVRFVL
jgi:hypothetical protein